MIKYTGPELTKKNETDAGWDIRASRTYLIPAHDRQLVSTDVHIAIPDGCAGLLWSRSGLSLKDGIEVGAGLIDASYRGEVKVLLYNHSDEEFYVEVGDRIAQLVIIPINLNKLKQVEELDSTERGVGGFGSTGVK